MESRNWKIMSSVGRFLVDDDVGHPATGHLAIRELKVVLKRIDKTT